MDADEQADKIRQFEKEIGKLRRKLAASEQVRERLEHHLDKNNSLFKANIRDLDAARSLAEEATKLKDQFVALVSHDLRSPLSSLSLGLEYVESKGGDNMNPPAREMLGKLQGSVKDLLGLIVRSDVNSGHHSTHAAFCFL